jgi:hypothetical protein
MTGIFSTIDQQLCSKNLRRVIAVCCRFAESGVNGGQAAIVDTLRGSTAADKLFG